MAELYGEKLDRHAWHYFDLEDPRDQARLSQPQMALEDLGGLIVLDEIQRVPELFPILRVLADDPNTKNRFMLLGSASPELMRQVSESLAGRIAFVDVGGFHQRELPHDCRKDLCGEVVSRAFWLPAIPLPGGGIWIFSERSSSEIFPS